MKVLLTRPQGRNQQMSDALDKLSVDHLLCPLIDITPSNTPPHASFFSADKLIFISANAVQCAAHYLHNIFPQDCDYFAVGEATQMALAEYQISSQCAPSSQQDSEGLLSLLSLQDVKRQTITIVRGEGGRETLAQILSERGANINYWQVYQRGLPTLNTKRACQQWQEFGIDTIVLTSGEALDNLMELVPKELFAWLHSCHIIVPSLRVQEHACSQGFHRVTNANGANTQTVLRALKL
ncbi:uroporphyrinogen-III synthase [Shewanella sp.]|uniref:uroporphyrinogen-III synthase n=1 Tax=Shewanella sp. TaxID=50422 RepID=UPI0040542463